MSMEDEAEFLDVVERENRDAMRKLARQNKQRARFAAMAMQGMLASDPNQSLTVETVAKWSVQCADALIEELKK